MSGGPHGPLGALRTLVPVLAAALLLVLLATRWVAIPRTIVGPSMRPTLEPGDRVVVDLWTYRQRSPRPGEIALFEPEGGAVMVKRVARSPGRALRTAGDGRPGPAVAVWVVGDNPGESVDSREFGPVPGDRFRGRVVWRYWPVSRLGPLK